MADCCGSGRRSVNSVQSSRFKSSTFGQPEVAFLRAMTEAIRFYKTGKEWTQGVIGKYLCTNDAENLERTYTRFRRSSPKRRTRLWTE